MQKHFDLVHKEEFKKILADYRPSEDNLHVLKQLTYAVLVAPTAGGRNTIINELLKTGNYYYIVSDTTRPPKFRDGRLEVDGVNYFFRGEEEVLADLKAGTFLEASLIHDQQVSGQSMRELKKALDHDKVAIAEIEIVGAHNIMRFKPDTVCIFVLPPNFEEWQRRIKGREVMSEVELRRRLSSALKEFDMAMKNDYYHFIINNTVEQAAQDINNIVHYGDKDEERQIHGRQLAEQLYIATKTYLQQ